MSQKALDANAAQVQLFVLQVGDTSSPMLDAWAHKTMTADEWKAVQAYQKPQDRLERQAARTLSRLVLSAVVDKDVAPSAWRFGHTDKGQPQVLPPHAGLKTPMPSISISHSHGVVALALGQSSKLVALGVDVESSQRLVRMDAIVSRYFALPEQKLFAKAPNDTARKELFFALWTLKEAYLKAQGVGLAGGMGSFAFEDPLTEAPRLKRLAQASLPLLHADGVGWCSARGELGEHRWALVAKWANTPCTPWWRLIPCEIRSLGLHFNTM